MSFASFSDFLAMGHHGLYVWTAYGICLAVLALNVAVPILAPSVTCNKRRVVCAGRPKSESAA
jgi:heme exporter protein CcmD